MHFSRPIQPLHGVSSAALPPQGSPPLEFRGGKLWGFSLGFNQDYSEEWFELVVNKGSYLRGDLAADLAGFEEVREEIRK